MECKAKTKKPSTNITIANNESNKPLNQRIGNQEKNTQVPKCQQQFLVNRQTFPLLKL